MTQTWLKSDKEPWTCFIFNLPFIELQKNLKKQLIDEMKNSEIFKSVMDRFPDAELINVNSKKDGVDND